MLTEQLSICDSKIFSKIGIKLQFIETKSLHYPQKSMEFLPYLSIIDALMNVGVEGVKEHLKSFELNN